MAGKITLSQRSNRMKNGFGKKKAREKYIHKCEISSGALKSRWYGP